MQHFVVLRRSNTWRVVYDGAVLAQAETLEQAMEAARGFAEQAEHGGEPADISVDDPDDGCPVVYETPVN